MQMSLAKKKHPEAAIMDLSKLFDKINYEL